MSLSTDPLETFREEAKELLVTLEESLMALEEEPQDHELIDTAFRALHTIKGSGNMFDLDRLVAFAHTVETVFAALRDGSLELDRRLTDLSLTAKDHLADLLALGDGSDPEIEQRDRELSSRFTAYLPEGGAASAESGGSAEADVGEATAHDGPGAGVADDELKDEAKDSTYRVILKPSLETFRIGGNPLLLISELQELGQTLVMGFVADVPPLSEIDPEGCYLHWDILVTTAAGEDAVRDVFLFVDGEIDIRVVDEGGFFDTDINYKRLGEILVDRGEIKPEDLEHAIGSKDYLGDVLIRSGYVTQEQVQSALSEQNYVRKMRETRRQTESSSTIKVQTEKLDELVNLVGEFVSLHANIAMLAEQKGDQDVRSAAEQMEGLIRQVRDLSIDLHMVPVDLLFSGFRRLVRDLCADLGKDVHLELEGTETELDKNVVDALKDPLLHLIRNSIDHGIETPEERSAAGKERAGRLKLSAYYAGAHVVIEIDDDGAGLNAERIRAKAVDRGLISAELELSESEIQGLIFEPGFSTAENATNVSGRGVGMDVVKRNIENLGGSIRVRSQQGVGTNMKIRIPLTLAIVEGLLARIGDGMYLINLAYIVECLELADVVDDSGDQIIDFRGEIVPYLDLRRFFRLEASENGGGQVVVVAIDDRKVGLVVDGILDKYQSVIKSLGKVYERAQGVSGAIILGDGRPALMLDVDRLARVTREELR